jgi:hypothetical protein
MTKNELNKALETGKVLAYAEYRAQRLEAKEVLDDKSGQKQLKTVVQHMMEAGGRPVVATQWLDGTQNPAPPAKKGQMVLVELSGFDQAKGHLNFKVRDNAIVVVIE